MTEPTAPAPAPIRRIHTAMLIIGVSGSGKTTLLATFAEYLWETYGKVLLLYSCDGGAIPTEVQKRMHQGLIRFWRMQTRSAVGLGLETLSLATKGYWPRRLNPQTGEVDPAVDLVAPTTEAYEIRCKEGHWLKTVPVAKLISPSYCATCKALPASLELQVTARIARTKGFEAVGGVAFDSITSMGKIVLHEMDYLRGHGIIGGEKSSFGGAVISGGQKYGGNNRADIGFAQTRADQFVRNSLSIPGLCEGPVWTGLTTEATDEGGLSIVGLKLPGQATTDESPSWFGSVAEAGTHVDDQGQSHYALYLRGFIDKERRRHLLKSPASPGGVPEVLIDPVVGGGVPYSQFNLGLVLRLYDADLASALGGEAKAGLPGLGATPGEYGESVTVQQPQPATSPVPPPATAPVAPGGPLPAPPGTPPATAPRRARARAIVMPTVPVVPATPVLGFTGFKQELEPPLPLEAAPPDRGIPPPPGMKPPARMPGA